MTEEKAGINPLLDRMQDASNLPEGIYDANLVDLEIGPDGKPSRAVYEVTGLNPVYIESLQEQEEDEQQHATE